MVFFIDDEVFVSFEPSCDTIGFGVFGRIPHRRSGDDQRSTSLIDQDIVDFVDDRIMQRALDLLHVAREAIVTAGRHAHIVAKIIKAQLVVGRVGDIARISLLAAVIVHPALDVSNAQT